MLQIIQNQNTLTMTSTELAELLGYEKKEINRKIRVMFTEKIDGGRITPSIDSRGYVTEYNLPELESKMFVAKHDDKYLEQITAYWISHTALAITEDPALVLARKVISQDEEIKRLELTKAQINDKRTATIMGKLGHAAKKIKKLEDQLQDVGTYQSIIAAKLPDRTNTPLRDNVQTWRLLKELSSDMQLTPQRVKDKRYGEVLAYHVDVIAKFKAKYL